MKLIDKEKALKIAESYGTTNGTTVGRHSGVADIIHYELAKLPTIEAVSVKHGKWLDTRNISYSARCNVCGRYATDITPYCPNCGAKMDGGGENG